jgi:hypothetical protein
VQSPCPRERRGIRACEPAARRAGSSCRTEGVAHALAVLDAEDAVQRRAHEREVARRILRPWRAHPAARDAAERSAQSPSSVPDAATSSTKPPDAGRQEVEGVARRGIEGLRLGRVPVHGASAVLGVEDSAPRSGHPEGAGRRRWRARSRPAAQKC